MSLVKKGVKRPRRESAREAIINELNHQGRRVLLEVRSGRPVFSSVKRAITRLEDAGFRIAGQYGYRMAMEYGQRIVNQYFGGSTHSDNSRVYDPADPVVGVKKRMRFGRGHTGPSFRKARKVSRRRVEVTGKYEYRGSQVGHQVIYVGHSSMPYAATVKYIGLGIVQWYMNSVGCVGSLITEAIGATLGGSASTARVVFIFSRRRTETDFAADEQSVSAGSTDTWEQFALRISNLLLLGFASYTDARVSPHDRINEIEMYRFKIGCQDGLAGDQVLPTRVCSGSDLKITISGKSVMQIQNRTSNESGGTNADDVDVNDANPLRGKQYDLRHGSNYELRNVNDNSGTKQSIDSNPGSGVISTAERTGAGAGTTTFGTMEQYLKKPPQASLFRSRIQSKYVGIDPGVIRRSVVFSKSTRSLDAWCRWITENSLLAIRASGAVDGEQTVNGLYLMATYRNIWLSSSRMFGLEKVCDTIAPGNGDQIEVGYEVILNMAASARRVYKPNLQTVVDLLTVP